MQDRSRVWQLLALAFAHPLPELHQQLADGRFQSALDQAIAGAFGGASANLPLASTSFRDFEAQYITLFDIGPKGRPLVPLCAGGYESLLGGQGRPRLMLQYARFYGHFGLKTPDGDAEHEMPDHLTCQLECLAWLSHLEGRAVGRGEQTQGYRQAQDDFITRLLRPQCRILVSRLSQNCAQRGYDLLFAALGEALEQVLALYLGDSRTTHDLAAPSPLSQSMASGQAQNLWG